MHDLPACPRLPILDRLGRDHFGSTFQEGGLGDDHVFELRHGKFGAVDVGLPRELGRCGDHLVEGHRVEHRLQIATTYLVPVVAGDLSLQSENRVGLLGRIREPCELQHAFDVLTVGGERQRMLFEAVVLLVRQSEAALSGEEGIAVRFTRIGILTESDQRRESVAQAPPEVTAERLDVGDLLHTIQERLQRLDASRLDDLLRHEGMEQASDLALLRLVARVVERFDDRSHVALRLVAQVDERPSAGLVGVDHGRFEPKAIEVAEQVVLSANSVAQVREVESMSHALNPTGATPPRFPAR